MRRKGTRRRILTWALTALLTVMVPVRDGMSAAPAHAQQDPIGNGGLDGAVGDEALGQSNGMGTGGTRGAGNSGGPLQAVDQRQPSTASRNLAGMPSPPTFPTLTVPGAADNWNSNHDRAACALMIERTTHVGAEVYSLSVQQPTLSHCYDPLSFNAAWSRDRLALRVKASAAGATSDPLLGLSGSASGVTGSVALALEYSPMERVSWTIESLMGGTQVSTQTLRYSPSPEWYARMSLGSSSGYGTSFATQQMEVGYQGSGGTQVALSLGRQLSGIAEYDTTIFTLSTSLHDVSAELKYASFSTMITSSEESSAGYTSHYSALKFAFPLLGWLWTVSGTMADSSNIMVDVSMAKDNLSVGLTLNPLDVRLSYEAKF